MGKVVCEIEVSANEAIAKLKQIQELINEVHHKIEELKNTPIHVNVNQQ